MHGYDKLTLTLEENTASPIPLVLFEEDIIKRVGKAEYRVTNHYNRYRIKLSPNDKENFGNIHLIIKPKKIPYTKPMYKRMVHQIELNPNHFLNLYAIQDCLRELDNSRIDEVIPAAYINRLDINADNNIDTLGGNESFLSHINVTRKQLSCSYLSVRRGQTEINYNGIGKDIIMVYDRGAKLESLDEDPTQYTENGRIERKLLKPSIIKRALNEPDNHMTILDLEPITEKIIAGEINPLEKVVLGTPIYPTASSLTHTQAVTLGKIMEAQTLAGYHTARKRYKNEPVFKKCGFVPFPEHQQPTTILRRTIQNFI